MNDRQLIAQINSCLDNETPIGISLMREGLWAYRRENQRLRDIDERESLMAIDIRDENLELKAELEVLKRKLNPPLATGLEPIKGTQAKVYDFIASYIEQKGYSPTSREIAKALNLTVAPIHEHLVRLEKKGYISRGEPGQVRALRITGARQ